MNLPLGLDEGLGLDRPRSRRYLPRLKRVRSDQWSDRVTVRLLAGQHPGLRLELAQAVFDEVTHGNQADDSAAFHDYDVPESVSCHPGHDIVQRVRG
jgi:hypothetical protein